MTHMQLVGLFVGEKSMRSRFDDRAEVAESGRFKLLAVRIISKYLFQTMLRISVEPARANTIRSVCVCILLPY